MWNLWKSLVYSTKKNLKNHFYATHDEKRNTFNWNVCTKSFQNRHFLEIHTKLVHERPKDYKCGSYDKSFSSENYLKKHIHTIHEGHKDHKCESCGKSFSQAGPL